MLDRFRDELKQVLRRFRRAPAFALAAVITVAIGVGANTAVFSILEGVALKPLPYPKPEELVGVWHTARAVSLSKVGMSPSNYFVYLEQGRYFQHIGLYTSSAVSVTGFGPPERVVAMDVTEGTLPALGVAPVLGTLFSASDDSPNGRDVTIVTYAYWQRKFGGDSGIVGKTINVNGKLEEIIGVMPRRFRFLNQQDLSLILPLKLDRNKTFLGMFSYQGLARLKPGATVAEANSDAARMLPVVLRSFPAPPGFSTQLFENLRLGSDVHPLKQDVVGETNKMLWILMGSVALVLLIACANVANLLLVRAEGRQQELSVRAALGASRARLAGDLLFESLLIGLVGSVLGLGLAYGATRLLVAMAPPGLPRLENIGVDFGALVFTLALALCASLLFGLLPALRYAGSQLGTGLRQGGRTASESRQRHRARDVLVVVQVALACVLLISSGLMMRTFRSLTHINPGFAASTDVETFSLLIPEVEVREPEAVVRMQRAIEEKLTEVPGVAHVGLTNAVPMSGQDWTDALFAQDHEYASGQLPPLRRFKFISPGLLETQGTPLISGRDFNWAETLQGLPVAMISENFAREYWGGPRNALGKRIRPGSKDEWREIVGVVGDVYDDGTDQKAPTTVYWPLYEPRFQIDLANVTRHVTFVVRSPRAGSQSLLQDVQQAVWSVDANLPLSDVHTLAYFQTRSMARTSFTLTMIAIAGAMALLLGMVGLYGVVAYSASQRTREIGIRIALGSEPERITRMFVRQGIATAGLGVAAGLAAAVVTSRLMSSLLFGVSAVDPATYFVVCAALAGMAALASYVPSRRAALVDPIDALRTE